MPTGKKTVNNGKFTSPVEVATRELEAAEWMLANPDTSWKDFIDYFTDKWGVQKNQVNIYRKNAFKRMNKMIDESISSQKKIAGASLLRQLKKAQKSKDPKLELAIRQEMNKVFGLYTTNIDVTSAGEQLEGFDIAKLVTFSKNQKEKDDSGENQD